MVKESLIPVLGTHGRHRPVRSGNAAGWLQTPPDTSKHLIASVFTVDIVCYFTENATIGKKLPIIPGMQVTVDIITGKKTILDYLLKPILRVKQRALRER